MKNFFQKIKNTRSIFGLLLFSTATSFCLYAQEEPFEDVDLIIDELFFDDQQFLEEFIESDFSYNFMYASFSYNSNTYFSGRDSGTDQFNVVPQISYYHSSGFNASVSGVYYQYFDPSWDFTSVSLGYFNTTGKYNNILYNLGYTKYFYTDSFDDFTNSLDVSLGIRNKKRTLGTSVAASYLFGKDNSYQIVSSTFANFPLKRTLRFAARFRPSINFIITKQTLTFSKIVFSNRVIILKDVSYSIFDLLNTQISFPISLTTNFWDFELGYTINLPKAITYENELNTSGFFSFSIGYMFDFKRK
jgi:hypothetical protein